MRARPGEGPGEGRGSPWAGEGAGGPAGQGGAGGLSGRRGSDKQAERAPGSESKGSQPAFGVHLESDTLGRVARPAKRWHRKGQRGRKRRRGQGAGSDRCVCECRVLAPNATRLGTTPPRGAVTDAHSSPRARPRVQSTPHAASVSPLGAAPFRRGGSGGAERLRHVAVQGHSVARWQREEQPLERSAFRGAAKDMPDVLEGGASGAGAGARGGARLLLGGALSSLARSRRASPSRAPSSRWPGGGVQAPPRGVSGSGRGSGLARPAAGGRLGLSHEPRERPWAQGGLGDRCSLCAVRTGPCGSGVHWASGQHHAVGRTRVHGGWSRATGRSSRQESRMRVGEGGLSSAVPPRHVGLGIPGGRRHLAQGLSVAGTWGRSSGGWTDERVNE